MHPSRSLAVAFTLSSLLLAHPSHVRARSGTGKGAEETLETLIQRGRQTDSDAVILYQSGHTLLDERFGRPDGPIEAMSATKSIVGLAVGLAVQDGKLALDQPVHEHFPEWNQGRKASVTVRHLLSHTSGLQANPTTEAIYRSPDFVQLALAAELTDDPGSRFFYNNKATNLIPALVSRAVERPYFEYLRERLFAPLGITQVSWSSDPAGNPQGMAGLQIRPGDLLRIGQMMLAEGSWAGRRLLDASWIESSTRAQGAEMCGWLWWRSPDVLSLRTTPDHYETLQKAGVEPELLAPLVAMRGTIFPDIGSFQAAYQAAGGDFLAYRRAVQSKQRPWADFELADEWAYAARGYLGQVLLVVPHRDLVAVRMKRWRADQDPQAVSFSDFESLVLRYARQRER